MSTPTTRRQFLVTGAAAGLALSAIAKLAAATSAPQRKFFAILSLGRLGLHASFQESVELATRYGFEGVDPDISYLASLSDDTLHAPLDDLKKDLLKRNLKFGAAGLPVEFRKDAETFNSDLKKLPAASAILERAGIGRVSTWIMPCSDDLT